MADKKVSELTAITSISGDDLLLVVNDPNGTPESRKVTIENFFSAVDAAADFQENVTIRGSLFIRGDNFIVDANTNFTADVVSVGLIDNVESAFKDRMQVANTNALIDNVYTNMGQKLGATSTVTITGDVTASETAFSANAVSLSTSLNTDSGQTIANYMQVANVNSSTSDLSDRIDAVNVNLSQRLGDSSTITVTGDVLASSTAFSANAVSLATSLNAASGQTIANYMQVANTISISTLQTEVAASTDFDDFKSRIAAL